MPTTHEAGSGVRRLWDVGLVIEEGHMYLCRGWENFYSAYDLRTGYFLLFRYDDDATMLIVKVFNMTMCCMRYANDEDASAFCLFLFLYIWLCLTSIVNGHCCIWTGNGSSSSDTGYSQSSSDYGCSESSSDSGCSESSSDSGSSTFGFVSHRLLTVIVAFGQVMGAAAATLATAKAAATMAVAKAAAILAVAKAAAILAAA